MGKVQDRLSSHLRSLERARSSADEEEVGILEEERVRLEKAIAELVKGTIGGATDGQP